MRARHAALLAACLTAVNCSGAGETSGNASDPADTHDAGTPAGTVAAPDTTTPAEATLGAITAQFAGLPHLAVDHEPVGEDGTLESLTLTYLPENLQPFGEAHDHAVRRSVVELKNTIGGVSNKGTGFLFWEPGAAEPVVITAAHVTATMDAGSLVITADDGTRFDYTTVENHYGMNDPGEAQGSAGMTEQEWLEQYEDLAVVRLEPGGDFEDRGLVGRDLAAEPLGLGEQLYTMTYQAPHGPGEPIAFSLLNLYGAENSRLSLALTDIVPDQSEDEFRSGGSGAPVLDLSGRVAGLASQSSGVVGRKPNECGSATFADIFQLSPGHLTDAVMVIPESLEECPEGLADAFIRTTAAGGSFLANAHGEPEIRR